MKLFRHLPKSTSKPLKIKARSFFDSTCSDHGVAPGLECEVSAAADAPPAANKVADGHQSSEHPSSKQKIAPTQHLAGHDRGMTILLVERNAYAASAVADQ